MRKIWAVIWACGLILRPEGNGGSLMPEGGGEGVGLVSRPVLRQDQHPQVSVACTTSQMGVRSGIGFASKP